MCLYPKLTKNRKYIANKKNKGIIPPITDERVLYVPVGCGKCMECKKQKTRQWSIRLQEEIRNHRPKSRHFVTLTFSNESIQELYKAVQQQTLDNVNKETGEIYEFEGYELDNEIATIGTRRFLERWRKQYSISLKHWLITEIGSGDKKRGHKGTENIHIHGIILTQQTEDKLREEQNEIPNMRIEIEKIWKYGWVYIGDYVNERTVNYCVKYVTKTDPKHTEYNAKILTSPGIGSGYIIRPDVKNNKYKKNETDETYTTRTGQKINLPIYYRNKIYTDKERENLWLEKLDKKERWVDGSKIDISKGEEAYYKILELAREKNKRLGYGNDEINWQRKEYEKQRRKINMEKRMKKFGDDEKN